MHAECHAAGAKKRVLLVDDHPIVRGGLRQLIDRESDLVVCGEAGSAAEALTAIRETHPDLLLLDIAMEGVNGIELTKALRESYPKILVLILSMHEENVYAERALRAGARGYLMKQESPTEVLKAIRRVLRGEISVSEKVTSCLLSEMVRKRLAETGQAGVEHLSDRELEIFELIGQGLRTREIAEKLGLSVKTVDTHRTHMRTKLRLPNSVELTRQAIRWIESDTIWP